ncbi:hypothetical protein [Streptomyces mirabilis]|uniref:hypothetical protein n=1 Tax=Streptomyces mirabilis TaxID=68239 RepID=UPI0036CB8DC3
MSTLGVPEAVLLAHRISPGEPGLGSTVKPIPSADLVPCPCGHARRAVVNQAIVDPRPLRRNRALLLVPRVVLRHQIRHWISHAGRPW